MYFFLYFVLYYSTDKLNYCYYYYKTQNSFSPNCKQQKTHLSQPKPFKKKRKTEETFFSKYFANIFLMKVSGKSHSAENPEETFMLAKRFVSCKIEGGGASMRTNWKKSRIEKTPVLKKKQNTDIACWHQENNFKTIFILKNLTMPKTVKGDPLRFFNIHSVAKYQKIEGGYRRVKTSKKN